MQIFTMLKQAGKQGITAPFFRYPKLNMIEMNNRRIKGYPPLDLMVFFIQRSILGFHSN